jgi:hypothetical protein
MDTFIEFLTLTFCSVACIAYLVKALYLLFGIKFLEKFPKLISPPTSKTTLVLIYLIIVLITLKEVLKSLHKILN